jgi:hypothetical protein
VTVRQRRDHRLGEQRADGEVGALTDRRADKGDIERLRPQGSHQLNRAALLEGQRDQGMRIAKRADRPRHERMERRRTSKTHADAAALAAPRLLGRSNRTADSGEDRLGLLEEGAAGRGQLDSARFAVEEARVQLGLKRANLLRQRRLLDAKSLGRAGDVAFFGNRDEIAEVTKLHILYISILLERYIRQGSRGTQDWFEAKMCQRRIAVATQAKFLMAQLLEWIEAKPRSVAEARAAWSSTCPLNCAWEDALTDNMVALTRDGRVVLTAFGQALLEAQQ